MAIQGDHRLLLPRAGSGEPVLRMQTIEIVFEVAPGACVGDHRRRTGRGIGLQQAGIEHGIDAGRLATHEIGLLSGMV